MARSEFTHPAWRVALGTAASYGVVLVALFVVLFVVPYLLFIAS
jgi:hypothetical protein